MARYIDADKMIDGYCTTFPYDLDYCDDGDLMEWLNAQPTADVAPRAEVAREIFEEIESEIVAALQSNYRAKQERVEKQLSDDFVSYMCEGKIAALRGMEAFVEELKNKYAEGEK